MSSIYLSIKSRIKNVRKYLGYDYDTMSEILGCSPEHYVVIENAIYYIPNIDDVSKICESFSVSADYLFCLSDVMFINEKSTNSLDQMDQADTISIQSGTTNDLLEGLTPDQRIAIKATIKAFRDHNTAKAKEA